MRELENEIKEGQVFPPLCSSVPRCFMTPPVLPPIGLVHWCGPWDRCTKCKGTRKALGNTVLDHRNHSSTTYTYPDKPIDQTSTLHSSTHFLNTPQLSTIPLPPSLRTPNFPSVCAHAIADVASIREYPIRASRVSFALTLLQLPRSLVPHCLSVINSKICARRKIRLRELCGVFFFIHSKLKCLFFLRVVLFRY